MIIPTLTTVVNRPFKEDNPLPSMGPEVLFGLHQILFISQKNDHTSDIRPVTLSSWLKQTNLLCHFQADLHALDKIM